jgi:alpha-L-fucosidase
VYTDHVRGEAAQYAGKNITDGMKDTYWAVDDSVTTTSFEIDLQGTQIIKYLVLQEYITLGQRIKSFTVELKQGDEWKPVALATTIGYKRILKIDPTEAQAIRINIKESKACPVISNVEVY